VPELTPVSRSIAHGSRTPETSAGGGAPTATSPEPGRVAPHGSATERGGQAKGRRLGA
jgi:hypothetical protein